jgi:hypothetical protein
MLLLALPALLTLVATPLVMELTTTLEAMITNSKVMVETMTMITSDSVTLLTTYAVTLLATEAAALLAMELALLATELVLPTPDSWRLVIFPSLYNSHVMVRCPCPRTRPSSYMSSVVLASREVSVGIRFSVVYPNVMCAKILGVLQVLVVLLVRLSATRLTLQSILIQLSLPDGHSTR